MVCRPQLMTAMFVSKTVMETRRLVVSVGEADAAAGRVLAGQEAGADGSTELLHVFLCFF